MVPDPKKKKAKRPLTSWQKHVKATMARYPGLSFKEALPKAKLTYRRRLGSPEPKPRKRGYPMSNPVRRRRYGRKRARRSFAIPLAPIGGMLASLAVRPVVKGGTEVWSSPIEDLIKGDFADAGKVALASYFGVVQTGVETKFELKAMKAWIPIILGFAIHWVAGKAGVNRVLARHKVPVRV